MRRLYSFIFLFLFPFYLSSTIIVTHGAFDKNASWYKPGGCFYEVLKESGQLFGQEVVSFEWDQFLGGVTHYERLKAGKALAEVIADLISLGETEIILIGHSYGGHVIKIASQILAIGLDLQDTDRSIVVSDRNKNSELFDMEFFKKICNEFKTYSEKKNLKELLKKKGLSSWGRPGDFLVDIAYTLGTPNDIPDYFANMDSIGYFYNFFSKGDFVQDLVGDVLLPEPKHDWAVNLDVRIKGSGWPLFWNKPNHMQMHAEIIARWILKIPLFLKEEKIGNFDKFTFDYSGQITFSRENPPVYTCKEIGIKEDGFFAKYDLEWLKDKAPIIRKLC